jgi:hypothetical protein
MAAVSSLRNLMFLLPIVGILVVSGCTGIPDFGGGGGVSGNGIVITKFEPSLSSIESNDDVRLHLEVQNRGGVMGTAAAVLMGISPMDWDAFNTEYFIGELLPADEERGTEGGRGTVDWDLMAPDLQRGERAPYYPMTRVFYSYQTNVRKPLTFLTSDEVRRAAQNGEALPAGATSVSAGPLDVTVNAGDFVRTKEGSWEQPYFPVEIKITNVGGGQIAGDNYPIGVEFIPPEGTMVMGDCPGDAQTEWIADYRNVPSGLTVPSSPNVIYLWDGKETTVTCRLQVVNPPNIREQREIKLVLSYIYFQDAKTTINVVGTTELMY